jgi:mono/diheme cytochrome c family protein
MLFQMIHDGWRDPFNRTERLTMPAFGGVLEAAEINAVIAYLKTLWTDEQRDYQRQQSEAE